MTERLYTTEDFEQKVLKADKPVLVDFYADWCGPCKIMTPMISQIAQEKAGEAYVYSLNVDELGNIATQYGIMSIPTLIVFENGKVKKQTVGVQPKANIVALFA